LGNNVKLVAIHRQARQPHGFPASLDTHQALAAQRCLLCSLSEGSYQEKTRRTSMGMRDDETRHSTAPLTSSQASPMMQSFPPCSLLPGRHSGFTAVRC